MTSLIISSKSKSDIKALFEFAKKLGLTAKILTEQEITVLKMAAKGMNNKTIADELTISVRTVESHLASIFTKLGLSPSEDDNRRVLAVLAFLNS